VDRPPHPFPSQLGILAGQAGEALHDLSVLLKCELQTSGLMAITYTEEKNREWELFKTNGGTITFEIDPGDICFNQDFEASPLIQPSLETGFELPPTSLIETPQFVALISLNPNVWDSILCRIYLHGGKVIYRKKENGKYEAICHITSSSCSSSQPQILADDESQP
jgi:hypothetical protein